MDFVKMHGTGNDFVIVDARGRDAGWSKLAVAVCDRHFGVGADGLILVLPSTRGELQMRMFNPDGSEAEMCGNGIRCFAKFVLDDQIIAGQPEQLRVETGAGDLDLRVHRQNGSVESVTVDMGRPRFRPDEIPVDSAVIAEDRVIDFPLVVNGQKIPINGVSMGNPHAVTFVNDVSAYPLDQVGPLVEHHSFFPKRVNFEIAQVIDRGHIDLRVWERGAGLTLACGTGACATMAAAHLHGLVDDDVEVKLPGGPLQIRWNGSGSIEMRGPARLVFRGTLPS